LVRAQAARPASLFAFAMAFTDSFAAHVAVAFHQMTITVFPETYAELDRDNTCVLAFLGRK
jgi:ADP-heptose:LPS heptosyltransferase